MEDRFNTDFSKVKIHNNNSSTHLARQVQAKAFTVGNDIYFNQSYFSPGTTAGNKLLAHELTHVVQQNNGTSNWLQRDLAVEPTVADAAAPALTQVQVQAAIAYNQRDFTEPAEIMMLRDVLGVSKEPAVIDEDFVNVVATYQAGFGLTPDGKLGRETAALLATEITREADSLGDPATGTELRRIARRMQLRGMVSARSGILAHRSFVGPAGRPTGMVSARIGGNENTAMGSTQLTNAITLDYTGEDRARVRWLQFINIQMRGTQPTVAAPVFNTGTVAATGGSFNYSDATTTNWGVNSGSATVPFYDAAGTAVSAANSSVIADQPQGWQATANAFAATLTPAATSVVLIFNFDTYAVRDGTDPLYHVRWSATYNFDVTAGTESAIRYSRISGGSITALTAAHRTALDTRYAGNTVR